MNFSEKLDFLMNLTGTKNSALGKALSFDPSYISRIRTGNRKPPKGQPFSRLVAAYFSKVLKDSVQLDMASNIILGNGKLPSDRIGLEQCLYTWLEDENVSTTIYDPVQGFISDMSMMMNTVASTPHDSGFVISDTDVRERLIDDTENVVPTAVFYGNEGKREAVKKFLLSLASKKKPFELLLFSDEDMRWLVESNEFSAEWAALLIRLIKNGSRIKIIHTISRNLYEMMEAIRKWLPLYATGSIQPYYYPLMRDGIYRRSLFIAKDNSALISTSVNDMTEGMANFYIKNTDVVKALEIEFHNYFKLCKPLINTYTAMNKTEFISTLINEEKKIGKYMTAHPVPSLWTMPSKVVDSIIKRSGDDALQFRVDEMRTNMLGVLKNGGSVTEFLTMSPLSKKVSKVSIPMSDMISDACYYYEWDEYLAHLHEAKLFADKYDNYNVIITNQIPKSLVLLTHLESDTVVASASAPTSAFVVSNHQFTAAFYEYLQRLEDISDKNILALSQYITNLEKLRQTS